MIFLLIFRHSELIRSQKPEFRSQNEPARWPPGGKETRDSFPTNEMYGPTSQTRRFVISILDSGS